jgi:hypothetical protein
MRRPLPHPPPGWEISGKADGGKRTIRCTKEDIRGNQCLREIRFTSNPPIHRCRFPLQHHEPEQTQLIFDAWASLPVEKKLQYEIASLVAITDAPLDIVENEAFHRVINTFVELGRTDPDVQVGSHGCKLTRAKTRNIIVEHSRKIHEDMIARVAQMPCVSLAIDAGTIEQRHFLDMMILAPYSHLKPFLYDAVENRTLTAADYGSIVTTAIKELHQKGVNVRSIVGDNLPAQVAALAHWSSQSYLKQAEESYLHGIKYSPCLCHFVQLVVGDLIRGTSLVRREITLQKMIAMVNCPEVRSKTHSRCFQIVKTRWLSRYEALTWLLSWEERISTINPKELRKQRRAQFRDIITRRNFAKLKPFHKVIYPFTQAIKVFEKDDITLCYVHPVLRALKKYFREEERIHTDKDPKYAKYCANALIFIQQRQKKLLDMNLIKAAYWLTTYGCKSLSENTRHTPFMYEIHLAYSYPTTLFPIQGAQGWFRELPLIFSPPDTPVQIEIDYSYTEEIIDEDELELEEPLVSPGCGKQILTFLSDYLFSLMMEDLGLEIPENVPSDIRHQVEETLRFFFCNPDSIAKCKFMNGSLVTEVEVWNWVKFTLPERIGDQVAAKVISILSIPASEASCERSLSHQKRIMGHLRTTSNSDLLRARFLFESVNH